MTLNNSNASVDQLSSHRVPRENIVLVLRTCRECGERKPLQHFLVYAGRVRRVVGDVKVCAACRMRRRDRIRKTPRHLGRYLDLPLDDWAKKEQSA